MLDWTNIDGGRHDVLQNGTLIIRNAQIDDTNLYSYLVHSEETFTLTFFNLTVTACGEKSSSVVSSSSRVERSSSVLPSSSVHPTGKEKGAAFIAYVYFAYNV